MLKTPMSLELGSHDGVLEVKETCSCTGNTLQTALEMLGAVETLEIIQTMEILEVLQIPYCI